MRVWNLLLFSLTLAACQNETRKSDTPLSDDFSRQEISALDAPALDIKVVKKAFIFPSDADDGDYGIDVSHHNGKFPWATLTGTKITFAFAKSSEGESYFDPQFSNNWRGLAGLSSEHIRRGAYHFLFPGKDGKRQAANMIRQVNGAGGFGKSDFPPVIDIEWSYIRDPATNAPKIDPKTGKSIDRWDAVSRADRVKTLLDCLVEIERLTSSRPLIYTNSGWWRDHIGRNPELEKYEFWVAHYVRQPVNIQKPNEILGAKTAYWQFSENANIHINGIAIKNAKGSPMSFDANKPLN